MRALLAALAVATTAIAWADDKAKAEALHVQAVKLEMAGKGPEAVKRYMQTARAGSAKAATRLSEIYDKGQLGVKPDYAESLKWFNTARVLGGEKMHGGWGCPPSC